MHGTERVNQRGLVGHAKSAASSDVIAGSVINHASELAMIFCDQLYLLKTMTICM